MEVPILSGCDVGIEGIEISDDPLACSAADAVNATGDHHITASYLQHLIDARRIRGAAPIEGNCMWDGQSPGRGECR